MVKATSLTKMATVRPERRGRGVGVCGKAARRDFGGAYGSDESNQVDVLGPDSQRRHETAPLRNLDKEE